MSRSANEGVIVLSGDEKKMSLIEVNCETDFVAKNENFILFVKELSEINNFCSSDLKKLNNSKHYLISSVCIAKNGAMIWNHTESSELKMKDFSESQLLKYLERIDTKTLLNYGVYQIESEGLKLFDYVKGDRSSIMGLPIKEIENYIRQYKK